MWRLVKDLFISVFVSVALMLLALVGLLNNKSIRPLYEGRDHYQYKVDAIDTMDSLMFFILRPVKKPRAWVPDFLEDLPGVGGLISKSAEVICFAPCFWMIATYLTIFASRRYKRWIDHFEQAASGARRPPIVKRRPG